MTPDTPPAAGLLLTPAELMELTGYRQPAAQLDELRRQGFWRARRSRTGGVILERMHYEAVSRGDVKPVGAGARQEPQLRMPGLRAA